MQPPSHGHDEPHRAQPLPPGHPSPIHFGIVFGVIAAIFMAVGGAIARWNEGLAGIATGITIGLGMGALTALFSSSMEWSRFSQTRSRVVCAIWVLALILYYWASGDWSGMRFTVVVLAVIWLTVGIFSLWRKKNKSMPPSWR
jgi:hypothetical protein